MKNRNFDKSQSFKNKCLIITSLFRYIRKSHHYNCPIKLRYTMNNHINAYSRLDSNLIAISKGAITRLNLLDIEALLFHEYGHMYQRIYGTELLVLNLIWLFTLNFLSLRVICLCFISTCLLDLAICRIDELHADRFSSHTLNKNIYIHLLEVLQKGQQKQRYTNQKLTAMLNVFSIGALKCNYWLFIYRLFEIIQHISILNIHPTFRHRINYIKKNG